MSGVNLIDFVMPSAVPAGARTGQSERKHFGGFHLSVPAKGVQHENASTEADKEGEKVEWWKPLLPLLGILILFKLATWFVGRDKR